MKMAGIVASTLRRRTFRQKLSVLDRYTAIDPGHISLSPTASHPPSRSPSFIKDPTTPVEHGGKVPRGSKVLYIDFWPECVNPLEQNLKNVEFETFDTLVPKANTWLSENLDITLVKCETIEKKVNKVDEVTSDNPMYTPKGNISIYVKGLRLWFVRYSENSCQSTLGHAIPVEIGYMNVIPKCLDHTVKYPIYENLPETYAAINAYLSESPLEGKILTIETVPLKLPRKKWDGPEVNPDQTFFPDEYLRHVLYITRIYFLYGTPEEELIGAQDFLPDFVRAPKWYSIYGIYPKYRPLVTAMHKAKDWIDSASNIRLTNIQTLEAVYRKHPENVHTGVNFVDKVESCAMIKFVRVTYVQPVDENEATRSSTTTYTTPPGLSYKTFIPAAEKVGMCSGAPQYENLSNTWGRAKAWMKIVDRRIIGVETFYHPMNLIWHRQDGAESTVMQGEWTNTERGERRHRKRRDLVHVVRIFLDGDYTEPQIHHLPPAPHVEEVNDCCCCIM